MAERLKVHSARKRFPDASEKETSIDVLVPLFADINSLSIRRIYG